jgi:hypothetical protein
MPAKRKKSKTEITGIPQFLEWRAGRPRWNPSAKWKALGWRGTDLRDERQEFVDHAEAVKRAHAINAALADHHLRGVALPLEYYRFAPEAAVRKTSGAAPPAASNRKTIGYLFDLYFEEIAKTKAEKTVRDYRLKLGVTLQTIGELRGKSLDAVRACNIELLYEPRQGTGEPFHLRDAYKHMLATRGVHMSKGCITAASAWLSWVKFEKYLLEGPNPCLSIKCVAPKGRTVTWDNEEIAALVDAADFVGLPSLGDAIILALDLTWAQQDILGLTWDKIDGDDNAEGARRKNNVTMFPKAMTPARERLAAIRQRQAAWPPAVRPSAENAGHVICSELDFGPWRADYFRHWFSMIRDIASAEAPFGLGNNGVREKRFQDLRDTAITRLRAIGMPIDMMATRSGHTVSSVQATVDKHYGERRRIARGANKWLEERQHLLPDA